MAPALESSSKARAALVKSVTAALPLPARSSGLGPFKLTGAWQLTSLLRVDNLLYQVRPGNYLGQNFGKITRVTETEVVLREIVQDAAGEWIERTATLQLQERAK